MLTWLTCRHFLVRRILKLLVVQHLCFSLRVYKQDVCLLMGSQEGHPYTLLHMRSAFVAAIIRCIVGRVLMLCVCSWSFCTYRQPIVQHTLLLPCWRVVL
jgi:hypothetical protein